MVLVLPGCAAPRSHQLVRVAGLAVLMSRLVGRDVVLLVAHTMHH